MSQTRGRVTSHDPDSVAHICDRPLKLGEALGGMQLLCNYPTQCLTASRPLNSCVACASEGSMDLFDHHSCIANMS